MPVDYIDKDIVCPFYQRVDRNKISCEGIDKNSYIHLYFITKQFQRLHEEKYCMNLNNYKNCPLYTIIVKQYEEVK